MICKHALCALIAALSLPLAAQAPPVSEQTASNFVPTRFTVTNEGVAGKPDVILIPGLASGRGVWAEEAKKLAPAYQLHLLQVNGFAGQPAGANATADPLLPAIVEDLHAYITAHKIRPVVIGHSLGGLLGLMLARKYPADVAKLVIVDANPFMGVMFGPKATVESVRSMAVTMRDSTLSQTSAQREAVEKRTAEMLAIDEETRRKIVSDGVASDPIVTARALFEDLQTDLRAQLSTVTTPTLVAYAFDPNLMVPGQGRMDAGVLDAIVRDGYRAMPNAKLTRVDGSRHFIMTDQPQRLHELILSMLVQ